MSWETPPGCTEQQILAAPAGRLWSPPSATLTAPRPVSSRSGLLAVGAVTPGQRLASPARTAPPARFMLVTVFMIGLARIGRSSANVRFPT